MADAAPRGRGGFGSRGDRGGDRGGRGRGARRGRRGPKTEEKEWQPVTKLGRLVKAGKITSMEQIYLHSLPVKEYQIVDFFLPKLKDEVMKVRIDFVDYTRFAVEEMSGLRLDATIANRLAIAP
jgi:small subunit ribosomal protein S2e